jgi:hypothetical protein
VFRFRLLWMVDGFGSFKSHFFLSSFTSSLFLIYCIRRIRYPMAFWNFQQDRRMMGMRDLQLPWLCRLVHHSKEKNTDNA